MPKALFTSKGVSIQLGRQLGRGGEGAVYEVPSIADQVAKLYHHVPNARKQAKLAYMALAADDELIKYAAWPQDTLHATRNGPVTGFLMPNVAGRVPIHMLYSPAHRRQDFPKAGWDFLLFAARNTAAAFTALHNHGHVLGDVNQGNVLVGADSKVVLIDCDSFQIDARGVLHLCEVGVSHFTPPELQGASSFDTVKRTFNHDCFGLALLVFHLLFGGRHPYSGVPLRKDVGEALETDIKAYRFAYARDARSRGIESPPNSLPLSIVPESMAAMFEASFTERGGSGGRPSAQQWLSALDALRPRLKKCGSSQAHVFSDHLPRCPWCSLEEKGVVYFVDLGGVFLAPTGSFVLVRVWAAIEAISAPPTTSLLDLTRLSVTPTPLPGVVIKNIERAVVRVAVVAVIVGLCVYLPALWYIFVFGGFWALSMTGGIGQDELRAERAKRRAELAQAQAEYRAMEARIRATASREAFDQKRVELTKLRDEYLGLPTVEKREIDKLHATAEARQKHQFLERFFIDGANIPGVGPAKKATLRSFSVETAADIEYHKIRRLRGFGDVYTKALVNWKKSCERQFVFNPKAAVSDADRNVVRARVATRRRAIEASLLAGPAELNRTRQQVISMAKILQEPAERAARRLAQAQADTSLVA